MPERIYGLTVVVLLCLGGSALAGRLSATRWGKRVGFGVRYLVVLVVVATAGPLVLDPSAVLGSVSNWALAVPCGLAAAALSVAADRGILAARARRPASAVPGFRLPTVLACGAGGGVPLGLGAEVTQRRSAMRYGVSFLPDATEKTKNEVRPYVEAVKVGEAAG